MMSNRVLQKLFTVGINMGPYQQHRYCNAKPLYHVTFYYSFVFFVHNVSTASTLMDRQAVKIENIGISVILQRACGPFASRLPCPAPPRRRFTLFLLPLQPRAASTATSAVGLLVGHSTSERQE